jgi:uncharacterized FlaG/YvyC family protein
MVGVANIELSALQATSVSRVAPDMPPPASGAAAPTVSADAQASAAEGTNGNSSVQKRKDDAYNERVLDQMALRLVKRDPGLAIEKDDVLERYVYQFLDRDDGKLVRQFPAAQILETVRALHQMNVRRAADDSDSSVAV